MKRIVVYNTWNGNDNFNGHSF